MVPDVRAEDAFEAKFRYRCSGCQEWPRGNSTGVDHELMVQSRGGHSSVVTATLEHSKKDVFRADVGVVISNRL